MHSKNPWILQLILLTLCSTIGKTLANQEVESETLNDQVENIEVVSRKTEGLGWLKTVGYTTFVLLGSGVAIVRYIHSKGVDQGLQVGYEAGRRENLVEQNRKIKGGGLRKETQKKPIEEGEQERNRMSF